VVGSDTNLALHLAVADHLRCGSGACWRSNAGPQSRRVEESKLTNVSQQLSPGAETIVDERTQERPDYRVEEGDHERFSHYVPKDKLTEAMVMGTPVVALCGKVWVPSRDPERFPVCPECQEIWESLESGDDEG
jgi:Protein of unknown function (DUF3039)